MDPDRESRPFSIRPIRPPASSSGAASLTSALSRRNATRLSRRNDPHRAEQSRNAARTRRLHNMNRHSPTRYLPPPRVPPEEPSSKRRRMERTGQVEMEHLLMELIHCDGGRFDSERTTYSDHSPECALVDDSSVYCTQNSRCNMILKHVDGECFSLQKLVIRAPAAGYTSPVRAGMIFVSMDNDNDELLKRTNYTVHYESEDNQCEDTSDDESFDFNFLESINDLGEPSFEEDHTSTRRTSSSVSMPWSNQDDQPRPPPPPPVDILEPNATFSHKDRKSKCVINFEPAISGRYILAKFFATPDQKNIDIEYVGAYGWIGRRFFPAITMR